MDSEAWKGAHTTLRRWCTNAIRWDCAMKLDPMALRRSAGQQAFLVTVDGHNKPAWKRITLGADRGYDTRGFVQAVRGYRIGRSVPVDLKSVLEHALLSRLNR